MTQSSLPNLQSLPWLLIGRRWWWTTLLVLLAMAVLARLGLWQLDRREQRIASNARLAAQLEQAPIPLDDGVLPAAPEELRDRKAMATGRFDFSQQIAISQQTWQDLSGIHLVAPLVLAGGEQAILVDRGWLPLEEAAAEQWGQFDEAGEVTISGYIELSQLAPAGRQADSVVVEQANGSAENGRQESWYRLDIETIQAQMPYDLMPVYLLQAPEAGNNELPYRTPPEVDLSEGPNLGYAIQWFLFAVILAVGYVGYVRQHERET